MLEAPVFAGLVVNAALLLALALFAGLIPRSVEPGAAAVRRTLTGLVVATFGVAVMLVPVALAPDLVFDVRSVLLSVAGMFFGIVPTAIGMLATAALRWTMGGVAAVPGIAVILASGAIGLLWRRIAKDRLHRIGVVELYGFGLVVHVAMVAILSTLPPPYAAQFWREAVAPVMLIYPVLTVIVGRLLAGRLAAERALEALRASEARFRTLFEGGPAILLIVDPADGSVVDANPAAVAFYGWSLDELRRRRLDEIDTLPRGELLRALARARAQDARTAGAYRHRLADGSERDVEMISGPIERDGRPLLYALVVDVHERRRAEERQREDARRREEAQALAAERDRRGRLAALNLAEDAVRAQRQAAAALGRLQLLIDHAPAALAMFDRDLRFTTVSRRFVTDYGLEGVPLIGRHHYEVFPEIPEGLRAVHRRALAGEVLRGEGMLDRGDGRVMNGRWEVRPWKDDRGEIGGIVLFTEDLSEERLAKEQLVKLSQAVEQSPLSIVITNPEAEIEYVNDAFVAATGYVREEVLGRNPRILNSGRTPAATYREMWAALQAGRSWKGEFVNRRKDGSEYVEFATVSPIFAADGRPAHYLALKEDVTEKKRIELLGLGVIDLRDLPDDYSLSPPQRAVVEAVRSGAPVVDVEAISAFIGALKYPLYFFDYETYSSAIPVMDGISPYEHLPVQYSLHIMGENGDLQHLDYLAESARLPLELVETLRQHVGNVGSFISWHAPFEKSRNRELAARYPDHAEFLNGLNDRMVDLEDLFKMAYVDARFNGYTSIKKVLPVLCPKLSYAELDVQDGTGAMEAWARLVDAETPEDERAQIASALRQYCELDTLAMVEIFRFLQRVI